MAGDNAHLSIVRRRSNDHELQAVVPIASRVQSDDKLRPYKGVTFYKRTGRWEANLWYENKQHYLGASSSALEAARAYDLGILFTRSSTDQLNFRLSDYTEDIEKMNGMTFLQYRQYLRDTSRQAKCQLVSKSLKGILIDENGKWEVKYCPKNLQKPKYVLVGWFDTEDEALRAYNETALQDGDTSAMIESFHDQQPLAIGEASNSRRRIEFDMNMRLESTEAIVVHQESDATLSDPEDTNVTSSDSAPMECTPEVSENETIYSCEEDIQEMVTDTGHKMQHRTNVTIDSSLSTIVRRGLDELLESTTNVLHRPASQDVQSGYQNTHHDPELALTEVASADVYPNAQVYSENYYGRESQSHQENGDVLMRNNDVLQMVRYWPHAIELTCTYFVRIQSYTDLRTWTEQNQLQPAGMTVHNCLPESTPKAATQSSRLTDLSYLKSVGPFDIDLSLGKQAEHI